VNGNVVAVKQLVGRNVTEDARLKTVTFDKSNLLGVCKNGLESVDDQISRHRS